MDRMVRARALLTEAASLGLTVADLVAAAETMPAAGGEVEVPTLREHLQAIEGTFTEGTAATYRTYWRQAEALYGDRPVDMSFTARECEEIVDRAVEQAKGRRPGCRGESTRENCIAALRALFARAEKAGYITSNPALQVEKPRRRLNSRRALSDGELEEVIEAVQVTSRDPDLDLLLVRFHLESGARREGALNLRLQDLDHRRSTVWLSEKFDIEREQPVTPSLLSELERYARSRGAVHASDSVFRTVRGLPISRRRYNTLFDNAQAVLPWTERTPVTAHVLRHTAATAVERLGGDAVAQAFLGHSPGSVTAVYTKAQIHEVAHVLTVLTGEPHPLAQAP